MVAKEVKLMAIHKGIRIHKYLDDWLLRSRSHQVCLQHTQDLVRMCQDIGWLVNLDKSEPSNKDSDTVIITGLSGPAIHVQDRSANNHIEASSSRSTSYETHTVASQKLRNQ